MITKNSIFKLINLTISAMLLSNSITALAKQITFYEQPNPDAKVVGAIDSKDGFIPIYQASGWTKIADPKNGNVGWIKSTELNNPGSSLTTYRIIQYGQPDKLTSEQTKQLVTQIQTQQLEMQKSMRDMMRDMDRLFHQNWQGINNFFPVFPQVSIEPVQNHSQSALMNNSATSNPAKQNNLDQKSKK